MTVVNPKSISGINSITMASGSDNLLTIHTTNTTERVRVNSDGDVIVGSGITVSPDGDMFATGVTTTGSLVSSGDVSIADKIIHTGDTNTVIRFPAADTITAETGGTERIRIKSDGRIAINDTGNANYTTYSPCLAIGDSGDSTPGLVLRGSATSNCDISFCDNSGTESDEGVSEGLIRYEHSNDAMVFHTADEERARITSDGKIGVNVTTPQKLLDVRGEFAISNSNASYWDFDRDDSDGSLKIKDTGTERLRITSGGVVQIGGATANSADIDTSNTKLTIKQSDGSAEDGIYIERSGERRGHYIYVGGGLSQSDALCVTTNQLGTDTDLLAIDRGGDIAVGAGDIFFSTSGKGIVLGATSNTDANTLDDYEEGVHTMSQIGSGGGVPLSNAVIRYTKIGNICQVSGMLDVGASSGSSSVEISLPFTSKADSGTTKSRTVSALMHKYTDVDGGYINIVGYIGQNENYMRIYNVGDDKDWHQLLSGDFQANNSELFFTFVYQTA